MNKKTKVILSLTSIAIMIIVLLSYSYGFYLTNIKENESTKSFEVSTANKMIKYTDLTETETSDIIAPGYENIKIFTVENIGDTSTTYHIYLTDVVNEFKRNQDIEYALYKKAGNNTITDTINFTDCELVTEGVFPQVSAYIKLNETIEENKFYTYALKVTYVNSDENQDIDQGNIFSSKVQIHGDIVIPFEEGTLAYEIYSNSLNATNGTELLSYPLTKVAEEISSYKSGKTTNVTVEVANYNWTYASTKEDAPDGTPVTECTKELETMWLYDVEGYFDEAGTTDLIQVTGCDGDKPMYASEEILYEKTLSVTPDDYGTSYYFRGNVEDNYVNFAGMCWRIVRIAGDGTTKLILEDQNTTCNDTETETTTAVYTGNWNIGTGNYGYELKNVDSDSGNEYIMNYLNPVTDNTSSMVKAFYDFQTSKLADYTGKLKSGDWCLGDKAYTRSGSSGSYTYTPLEEYNYSGYMYYDAYTRLSSGNANGYQPTLKCNGTILSEFAEVSGVSSKAPMYVSAITADEIVYAGGKSGESNYNYYLMNDYSKGSYYFWSLSPNSFDGSDDLAFRVDRHGYLDYDIVNLIYDRAYRPAVSLVSSVEILSGGNGTKDKPYVVG